VRVADGCTGLLAAAIADKAGSPSARFLTSYATAHLDRSLTPVFTLAARGWQHSVQWSKVPAAFTAIRSVSRYLHGPGRADDPAQQEARVREGFTTVFGALSLDQDEMFRVAIDQFVALVLTRINPPDAAP
jgi:hypothetical protein